jgi:hypothetical protein
MPLQYLLYLTIVFWLLSRRGPNKKMVWEWGEGVYVYEELVQTHLPLLSNFNAPPPT